MKQVFIYEGSFGAAAGLILDDLTDVIIDTPNLANGQPLCIIRCKCMGRRNGRKKLYTNR